MLFRSVDTENDDDQTPIKALADEYNIDGGTISNDAKKNLYDQYLAAHTKAEEQRDLLRTALEKNLANRQPEDKSEMYFRLAAALAAPTKTQGWGEPLMNVANAMAESRASERAQRQKNIAEELSARQALSSLYGGTEKELANLYTKYNKIGRAHV